MSWLIAAAVLLILILVAIWLLPLPRTAMVVIGGALVAVGFLRLAYVEWDYLAVATKPLDVPLPLDRAVELSPVFKIARAGQYDVWLQSDRPSALFAQGGCDDGAEGSCPDHQPLDLRWSVDDGGIISVGPTAVPRTAPSVPDKSHRTPNPTASAEDQTPEYRFLGSFIAIDPGQATMRVDVLAPYPALAARHPRLIVGLSDAETAPAGYFATMFCVLCVFGGGFILLKTLVPRKSPT
jgi:hypothetical protein